MRIHDADPKALAALFVRYLREDLMPAQFEEMRRRNAAEDHPDVCHSHDFLDANMTMAAAWQDCGLPRMRAELQSHADVWNAAWEIAMPELGRRKS